jgi:hypothetical protein
MVKHTLEFRNMFLDKMYFIGVTLDRGNQLFHLICWLKLQFAKWHILQEKKKHQNLIFNVKICHICQILLSGINFNAFA